MLTEQASIWKKHFFISHIELKTDLSKLMEMNDLINGRSWTEERVQHSKYFPKWNWLTFWTIQIYDFEIDQWKPPIIGSIKVC